MDEKLSDQIVGIFMKEYPNPVPDLLFSGNFQLLISVVLSARTTDVQVNRVTPSLFKKYPSFSDLASALPEEVEAIVKSTGFYKTKAANIIRLSEIIIRDYSGRVPDKREELMKLPGVGRKTANVVLSVAFGIPAFAVDTHVSRISRRLGYTETSDPLEVEKAITSIVKKKHWGRLHLAMILHGRKICKSASPSCGICSLSNLCAEFSRSA